MGNLGEANLKILSPSPFVRRFANTLVRSARGNPIVDVACGGARNGILLAHLGANVIGVDIDLKSARLSQSRFVGTALEGSSHRVKLLQCDVVREPWPFKPESVGGILNVHFLHMPLLSCFSGSLIPGGCLLLETVGGQGGNYLQLPHAGMLRLALRGSLSVLIYQERCVGPPEAGAVTVKLLAVKESSSSDCTDSEESSNPDSHDAESCHPRSNPAP